MGKLFYGEKDRTQREGEGEHESAHHQRQFRSCIKNLAKKNKMKGKLMILVTFSTIILVLKMKAKEHRKMKSTLSLSLSLFVVVSITRYVLYYYIYRTVLLYYS